MSHVVFVADDYWTNPPERNNTMTDNPDAERPADGDYDLNDFRAAVDDWRSRRPPKDIEPNVIPPDAPPIPGGLQTLTTDEVIEDDDGNIIGVTRTETTAWIAPAIGELKK